MPAINHRFNNLLKEFTQRYLDILSQHATCGQKTYGFEYEFLPRSPLVPADLDRLFNFLSSSKMMRDRYEFITDYNMRITFEPGGQLEYCSPPLAKYDDHIFSSLIECINKTNAMISSELGIEYVGIGFFPGRGGSPLCLRTPRYLYLHERLKRTGSRGPEMMKGTASIHLHVMITKLDTLIPLFHRLCHMAMHNEFKMLSERRDIWNNTDPIRCGLPLCCQDKQDTPAELVRQLIRFALYAEVLGEDVPFFNANDQSFEAFLYHMTTLFTDVRFNLKGPTLELRTLDSMPTDQFVHKWKRFIFFLENI